jgi:NitT/TauT family transport system permease protein
VIVFIGAFPAIFTSAYEGAESVSLPIRRTARSMGITNWSYLWKIAFPASLPQLFTGLRVSIGMGWMSVIAAEMISGQSGLGYSIQLNRLNMQYGLMTVDMILISIIGFLLFESVVVLQRTLLPWKEEKLT